MHVLHGCRITIHTIILTQQVLEDMSKRIDANTAAHVELKASVSDLSELIVGQASNTNSRFTSVDQALRDVDRGVQVRHPRSFMMSL